MENFQFLTNEQKIILTNGNFNNTTVKIFLSAGRLALLQPQPRKNTSSLFKTVIIAIILCIILFAIAISFGKSAPPTWLFPACMLIVGSMAQQIVYIHNDPCRCLLIRSISTADIKKIKYTAPLFDIELADGEHLHFSSSGRLKNLLKKNLAGCFCEDSK